jgi:hypothetical protein
VATLGWDHPAGSQGLNAARIQTAGNGAGGNQGKNSMNATELKTLRQSLFISVAEAAALHQVNERVYRYWESGEWAVPDDVAAKLAKLDDDADSIADAIAEACEHRADKTRPVVLFRFACDEDLWAMTTRTTFNEYLHGIPAAVYAAGIDRARQDIKRAGEVARVVTMDRAAYQDWLADHGATDSGRNRQDWAATVTEPPTRAKKRAQASGEGSESARHGR